MDKDTLNTLLDYISDFIKFELYPEHFTDSEKAFIEEKSRDFVLESDDLHFVGRIYQLPTCERRILRKVLFQEGERNNVILSEHISEDGSHLSFTETLRGVCKLYYWPSMYQDTRESVQKCCTQETPSMDGLNVEVETVCKVWEKVDINICGPYPMARGYSYIITCIDYYSTWCEAMAVNSKSAQAAAHFLINLLARYGFPEKISSSTLGESFCSSVVAKLETLMGEKCQIEVVPSFLKYDETMYAASQNIHSSLAKLVKENKGHWDKLLEVALFPHRISQTIDKQTSPFFQMYQREPRLPFTMVNESNNESDESTDYHIEDMDGMVDRAIEAYMTIENSDEYKHVADQYITTTSSGELKTVTHKRPGRPRLSDKQTFKEVNMAALKFYLSEGKFARGYGTQRAQMALVKRSELFRLEEDQLYYCPDEDTKKHVCISTDEIYTALSQSHSDKHIKADEMLEVMSQKYYWASLAEDIHNFCTDCVECNKEEDDTMDDSFDDEDVKNEEGLDETTRKRRSGRITKHHKAKMKRMLEGLYEGKTASELEGKMSPKDKPVSSKKPANKETNSLHVHERVARKTAKKTCGVCQKSFFGDVIFAQHMSEHTGLLPYFCDICFKRFRHRKYVETHRMLHTGEKPFVCKICKKGFVRIGQLNTHINSHEETRRYLCSYCPKSFPTNTQLKNHATLHSNEKRHKCPHCPKMFKRKSDIYRHKVIHATSKPYKCEICNKMFTRAEYLNDHKNHHTGVKPYECKQCKKAFHDRSAWRYHDKCFHKKTEAAATVTENSGQNKLSIEHLANLLGGDQKKVEELVRTGQAFFVTDTDADVEYQIVCSDVATVTEEDLRKEDLNAINILAKVTTEMAKEPAKQQTTD